MKAGLSSEQLTKLWELGQDRGIYPTVTRDRWGDDFVIFEDWAQVRAIAALIPSVATAEQIEMYPAITEDRPNVDYFIGEYGFSDEYTPCSHCGVAIHTQDMHPDHWFDTVCGDVVCGDCLRGNKDFADDYLSYCADQLRGDDRQCVYVRMANPADHGFIPLNPESGEIVAREDNPRDHPNFPYGLEFANDEELARLGKAAHLIDPDLQIVYSYNHVYSGAITFWARFSSGPVYIPALSKWGHWSEFEHTPDMGYADQVLGYVCGLVFAKWGKLRPAPSIVSASK